MALFSALVDIPARSATVILGEITIQGGVLPVQGFGECIQLARENGARYILVPTANVRDLAGVPSELLSGLEVAFYADPRDCLLKALTNFQARN